jgi:hypothetical protein
MYYIKDNYCQFIIDWSLIISRRLGGIILYIYIFYIGGSEPSSFLSQAAPQRTACSEAPSQMAAHLRTGSPLEIGETLAGFDPGTASFQPVNAGLKSGTARLRTWDCRFMNLKIAVAVYSITK